MTTAFHAKYFAHELTRRYASDNVEKLVAVLADAKVDLNPHQIDAALFAFRSPFSKGAILADASRDAEALAQQLAFHTNHIRTGRSAEDILYEILLKSGFPLTTSVETLTLAGNSVYSVAGDALLICLEDNLTLDLIRAMADLAPERVVCLDVGFSGNDQLKTNAVQIFRTKDVTSFKTV